MCTRLILLLTAGAGLGFGGDWNPKRAADYLDSRQKTWIAWKGSLRDGAPCISCHTNLPYLLARPALSKAAGEGALTTYQTTLLDSVRGGLVSQTKPGAERAGTESVLGALLLASEDARRGGSLSPETEQALDRLWALQNADGPNKGAWGWYNTDLEPWEEPASIFYGASLAALAVGTAPGGYASRPSIQGNLDSLKTYLRENQGSQPLQNRLVLAWAASRLPGLLPDSERKSIVDGALAKQQDDGGWTVESLGPWKPRPHAPPSSGSSAYATGLTAFTLQQAGVPKSNPAMRRALDWLRARQDPATGAWVAVSLNKEYEPESIAVQFMSDAATGYASLALLAGQ